MNRRWRKPILAAALVAGAVSTGCGHRNEAPPPPTPEVAVVTVRPQEVVMTTELPGRTCPYLVAEIRPQVSGLIQKRLFAEGSEVKKGELLYEIDPAPFQAAYDNAAANVVAATEAAERARANLAATIAGIQRHRATLALAEANRQRSENLFKSSAVSAMERDQTATEHNWAEAALRVAEAQVESDRKAVSAAEAAIKQSEAALKSAEINLAYTKITAPISGRIGRSEVTEGAIVIAYQPTPLATIQALDPIYVDVRQSTAELNQLKRNLACGRLKDNGTDGVKIILEDASPYPLKGSLKFRDVSVDPTTGSVVLRIVVPNPQGFLLPSMFVRAVIDEGVNERAILVPQQAVARDPKGNPTALIVDAEGKVQQRRLSIERAVGDQWLVSSGLDQGDRVIVEGAQKVRPGAAAKAVQFQAAPAAAKPESAVQAVAHSN